ncbi:MAG: nucleotide exchange factor GrpE [Planctomycetota bacterium]
MSDKKPETSETTSAEATANQGEFVDQNEQGVDPFVEAGNQLATLQAERDDFRERWLRSQAELENYRKRAQKELETERQYRSLPVVRDVLPALDNLQRALQVAKSTKDADQLIQGVQMVAQQFEDALTRHAVVTIKAVGQPFDPNFHEAIQQAPSKDHPPMTVLHDVETGYQMYDRVIRPTKVIVSVAPAE